jgi:hypothetical protein
MTVHFIRTGTRATHPGPGDIGLQQRPNTFAQTLFFRFSFYLQSNGGPYISERKRGCAEIAAQHSAVQAGRRPSRERRVAALTARGGRRGTGQDVALSVSLCCPGRATTNWVTFFSSVEVIRPQLLDRNARPERVGEQSLPQVMRKTRIARVCRSVHGGKRDSCRRAWSSKRPAGAETGERYGRALPVFFPIGHRGGATAFTPSGASFEISRPPPPSQALGPISQKSLSGRGITPRLGSSCAPRPSGQYVPTGQKPI